MTALLFPHNFSYALKCANFPSISLRTGFFDSTSFIFIQPFHHDCLLWLASFTSHYCTVAACHCLLEWLFAMIDFQGGAHDDSSLFMMTLSE